MADDRNTVRLFLCGDVMLGRGIGQIMPQACDPILHEPWVDGARTYRRIAEAANGGIPAPVEPGYVWGDALARLREFAPDLRVINLETAVTCNTEPWPAKDIHYRMHPDNVGVLRAVGIDTCALANNHVLDWGHAGLNETLKSLRSADIAHRRGRRAPRGRPHPRGTRAGQRRPGHPAVLRLRQQRHSARLGRTRGWPGRLAHRRGRPRHR